MSIYERPDALAETRTPNVGAGRREKKPDAVRRRSRTETVACVLGRMGSLSVRLATSKAEIRAAQAVRYQVFFREMAARSDFRARVLHRDCDAWDAICDHMIVVDESAGYDQVVGTYRLLRGARARETGTGFYTQSEFDVAPLVQRHPSLEFLELGRSCVLDSWRGKRTIELLWHGTWAYVLRHRIDVMFGCASFHGADPQSHCEQLAALGAVAPREPDWDVRAQPGRAANVILPEAGKFDPKRAIAGLPPLIKGYVRLGAWIGRDVVVDSRFNTTDILILLPVSRINPRYVNHYGADAGRYAGGRETESA